MRLDQAKTVKIGDVIFNVFLEPVTVSSIHLNSKPPYFEVVDTRLNTIVLPIENLYLPYLEELPDEEMSFLTWMSENKDILSRPNLYNTFKYIYTKAFLNGYNHKMKVRFEEQMQK